MDDKTEVTPKTEVPTGGVASSPQLEAAIKRTLANTEARLPDEVAKKTKQQERGVFIFTAEDGSHGIQLRGVTVLEAYAAVTLVYNKLTKQFSGDA